MKRFIAAAAILGVLAILIPSAVLAEGVQNWTLTDGTSGTCYLMDKTGGTNYGGGGPSVSIPAGVDEVWISDQVSQGVTFPANGLWTISLQTDSWVTTSECGAEVGEWNGSTFTPVPASDYQITETPSSGHTYIVELQFTTADFTIVSGAYLALQITNGDSVSHTIYTGPGTSNVSSPSTDPGYPLPEAESGVLLGAGLVGMGTVIVIRRKRVKTKELGRLAQN